MNEKCREEMEQAREGRDLEQAWAKAAVAKANAEGAVVKVAVLEQARAVIAFVPIVVKGQLIKQGPPAMSKNALSVERP